MDDAVLRSSAGDLAVGIAAVPAGRWGVGVSGGADSVALLLLLAGHAARDTGLPPVRVSTEFQESQSLEIAAPEARSGEPCHDADTSKVIAPADSIPVIHIIHLDHETRDGESAQDAAFVTDLAGRLHLPATIGRRSSIEAGGDAILANTSARFRAARFKLFRQVVSAESLNGVILAHHADDQAETVLQQILRGAGPTAISGMKAISIVDGLKIYRPLLNVPSSELRAFLKDSGQSWREDSSNQSDKYLRNRLRRWLANRAAFRHTLLDLGSQSAMLRDWLDERSPKLNGQFRIEELANLPVPLARHAASRWLTHHGAPPEELNRQVCDRLIEMATDAASPPRQHFPGAILIRRARGVIHMIE